MAYCLGFRVQRGSRRVTFGGLRRITKDPRGSGGLPTESYESMRRRRHHKSRLRVDEETEASQAKLFKSMWTWRCHGRQQDESSNRQSGKLEVGRDSGALR